MVASDFRGADKGRDDIFAATPPLEAKRMLLSKAATRNTVRGRRKLLFIDVKKGHRNPRWMSDVFILSLIHISETTRHRTNFKPSMLS